MARDASPLMVGSPLQPVLGPVSCVLSQTLTPSPRFWVQARALWGHMPDQATGHLHCLGQTRSGVHEQGPPLPTRCPLSLVPEIDLGLCWAHALQLQGLSGRRRPRSWISATAVPCCDSTSQAPDRPKDTLSSPPRSCCPGWAPEPRWFSHWGLSLNTPQVHAI